MDTLSMALLQENPKIPTHLLTAKAELHDSLQEDLMNPIIRKFATHAGSVLDQARLKKDVDQRELARQVSSQLTAEWRSLAKVQVDAWSQKDLDEFVGNHVDVFQEITPIQSTRDKEKVVQESRYVK